MIHIKRLSSEAIQRLNRLQRKRERRRLKRKDRYRARKTQNQEEKPVSVRPLIAEYYASVTKVRKAKRQKSLRQLYFPRKFSLIDEPDDALKVFESFLAYALNENTEQIHIDQGACETIDHGAESILGALGMSVASAKRINFSGYFPEDQRVKDIVSAVGLPKVLGVDLPEPEGFTTFALRMGTSEAKLSMSSSSDMAATELANYINACLSKYDYQLKRETENWLLSLMGEVLRNCEEHGGKAHWYIAGYMRQEKNQQYGDCHISIFNFGRTIYETMQDLPKENEIRGQIEDLIRHHTSKGFLHRESWTEENLWTLYALQEAVTSKWNDRDSDRGTGTAEMIEFFQLLGDSNEPDAQPRMCVLSGSTQIIFDTEYCIEEIDLGGELRRVIAFNKDNDLREPPDKRYVRSIKRHFPGTMITMDFYLDPVNLNRIQEAVCK